MLFIKTGLFLKRKTRWRISTPTTIASVSLITGQVTFLDKNGKVILMEAARRKNLF